MSQPLWKKLRALADLDNQIKKLDAEVLSTNELIHKNKDALETLGSNKSKYEEKTKEKRKNLRAIELQIKEIDETEISKKKLLETLSHPKEYSALEKELSIISIERQDLEDILVKNWQELETIEKNTLELSKELEEKANAAQEITKDLEEKINMLYQSIKELETKKVDLCKDIPANWLSTYDKMKNKVDNPIVITLNSSCSHCYYHILPQDLEKIKNGRLLHCKSCFRLLYFEAPINKEGIY